MEWLGLGLQKFALTTNDDATYRICQTMIAKNRIEIGARLRQERDRLERTQDELAAQCGVSKRTQAAWEMGEQVPHAEYLSIAASLGVDILFVITGSRITQMQSQTMGAFLSNGENKLLESYRLADAEGRTAVDVVVAAVATARPRLSLIKK